MSKPSDPIFQDAARAALERLRIQFEAGDKMALFAAIRKCANHDLVMPEWVAMAFIRGYDAVLNLRARSWDKAFGQPYHNGMHLRDGRFRREKRFLVWCEVRRRTQDGQPIDERLFEEVGKDLGMKRSLASKLYYEAERLMPKLP